MGREEIGAALIAGIIVLGPVAILDWLIPKRDNSYQTMAKLTDTNKDSTTTHEEWGAAFGVLRELGEGVHYDVHVSPKDYLSPEQIRKYNTYMQNQQNQEAK